MQDHVLVVNCGSSSIKLALYGPEDRPIASALAENLGTAEARATIRTNEKTAIALPDHSDHEQGLAAIIDWLEANRMLQSAPGAVGHRVVHGGERFSESVVIDEAVTDAIEECADLAPLHNPVNLTGIRAMQSLYPNVTQVAVFDTAFHQTLPPHAYLYALPRHWYEDWGVRRYGFHGTSHACMLQTLSSRLKQPSRSTSLISAHLGNGCSITAIEQGQSVDTSMGLTPLEGLIMGTRSGDVDPGLFDFLQRKGLDPTTINQTLNRESGLRGLSGNTNDMRALEQASLDGDEHATVAIEAFCFRLARYIGAMMASLTHCDGLVFTGGIGENSVRVREKTVARLAMLGFTLDPERNRSHGDGQQGAIHADGSHPVYVIPTDEEGMIAADARTLGAQNV
ncbi:acetate kinase [Tamilnaduibacter salinus]|uniref:Acetate kinase n=1 Tax=Tamilnaduibacter salinus TaxID=1484056 RepID=A0A2U1CYZ0_9GAMM|nr:acetate kinase [Tamilnaduibacter salinus]PVY78008.1 acetate kinase [Tamilnaduibacter salinus]